MNNQIFACGLVLICNSYLVDAAAMRSALGGFSGLLGTNPLSFLGEFGGAPVGGESPQDNGKHNNHKGNAAEEKQPTSNGVGGILDSFMHTTGSKNGGSKKSGSGFLGSIFTSSLLQEPISNVLKTTAGSLKGSPFAPMVSKLADTHELAGKMDSIESAADIDEDTFNTLCDMEDELKEQDMEDMCALGYDNFHRMAMSSVTEGPGGKHKAVVNDPVQVEEAVQNTGLSEAEIKALEDDGISLDQLTMLCENLELFESNPDMDSLCERLNSAPPSAPAPAPSTYYSREDMLRDEMLYDPDPSYNNKLTSQHSNGVEHAHHSGHHHEHTEHDHTDVNKLIGKHANVSFSDTDAVADAVIQMYQEADLSDTLEDEHFSIQGGHDGMEHAVNKFFHLDKHHAFATASGTDHHHNVMDVLSSLIRNKMSPDHEPEIKTSDHSHHHNHDHNQHAHGESTSETVEHEKETTLEDDEQNKATVDDNAEASSFPEEGKNIEEDNEPHRMFFSELQLN